MSRIRADKFVDRAATGAPELTQGVNFGASGVGGTITAAGQAEFTGIVTALGVNVSGVVTATTFLGDVTGDVTGNVTGNATGLSGSPTITVTNINAADITASGTLTYEDVTNVDSVGLVTARSGLRVLGAGVTVAGIATFHNGADFNAILIENVNIVANKLSAVPNINLDNGMAHYYTTNETTTANPNVFSTVGINTELATGETIAVSVLSKPNGAGYFPRFSIDHTLTGITTYWNGGSAPSSAQSSGVDLNTYQIIKTGDGTFDVLANTTNFA